MKNIVHWCKLKKMWTSHTYKSCAKATTILINGDWYTETKPDKKDNPRGWVVSDHTNVIVNPSDEILSKFVKVDRLIYDKHNVEFSHKYGQYILFDNKGCHILEVKL